VSIALDLAASEFRQPDGRAKVAGDLLTTADMIDRLAAITGQFPVYLIEDGWIALTARLGGATKLVGDDIFCTNPAIITRAIARGIGNSALIGATARGERVAKYNRLLEIAAAVPALRYGMPVG
jgi:enolase 1/2/3